MCIRDSLSKELLDGHPHVIVGHYLRRAPQSTEAVAVCFHPVSYTHLATFPKYYCPINVFNLPF